MKSRTKKNLKNKLILCVIGIILGIIELPILFYLEQNYNVKGWLSFAYVVVYYIAFRILIFVIQKILINTKILKYYSENLDYYKEEKDIREGRNLDYKIGMDRFWSRLCFMICYLTVFIMAMIQDGRIGTFWSIFLVLLVNIPLIVASKPPIDYTFSSLNPLEKKANYTGDNMNNDKKFDLGIKRTYIRNQFGNITGSATSYKIGDVHFTEIKDKEGRVTSEGTSYGNISTYQRKK